MPTDIERQARGEVNPFVFEGADLEGGLTSKTEEEFCAALGQLGLTLPAEVEVSYRSRPVRDWVGWYARVNESLTPPQRDTLWDLLDELRLYEVVKADFGL